MKSVIITVGLVLATATGFAAQSGNVARQEGPMLFKQYCATCHGLDAQGTGPTAATLKNAPADLTQLQAPGKPFPGEHVIYAISGQGEGITAHGSREMPVWGQAFRYTKGTPPADMTLYRLVEYLKTIQVNK